MNYLSFIPDEKLLAIVGDLIAKGKTAKEKAEKDFNRNVIDPFSVLFEMGSFELDAKSWLMSEKTRQAQKTLSNHVGEFHQRILGAMPDWEDAGEGGLIDVLSKKHKIIAEVKNKHNTTKGSDKVGLYDALHDSVMRKNQIYKGYTAYYVEVIPKVAKRYDEEFTPPDRALGNNRASNPLIRRIDGYSFYALASGVPDALEQLFEVLPSVIAKVANSKQMSKQDVAQARTFFKQAFGQDKA